MTDGNKVLGRMGRPAVVSREKARALNVWCRSLALLGVVVAACGEPASEGVSQSETVRKVQEAVVDLDAPLGANEERGARYFSLTFWPWNQPDPISASGMQPVSELASGTGRVFHRTSHPAGTYWIAEKNSSSQGEWVTHLLKSKVPSATQWEYALWLTHSQFMPTGQSGPGGVIALDPPGLVNGEGFVQPNPQGGLLQNSVVSSPSAGAQGTRWNWTNGAADTGVALRVKDEHLIRVPFIEGRTIQQSFLVEINAYVPSHSERAGGASIGNAIRPLMFMRRGTTDVATTGMTLAPVDFSAVLDQWVPLQVRVDLTTSGGTLPSSSDDWAHVRFRSYLNGQLVHTEEPTVNTATIQGQTGPILLGPGFAALRART